MASHLDMKRLGDDAAAVKRLAMALRDIADAGWTPWEHDFLDNMAERSSTEPLSQRQREVLTDLRDNAQTLTTVQGFAISRLIRECWLNRFDLDDESDLAFIERLKSEAPTSLKRRPAMRLLSCANRLDVVPRFAEAS